MLCIVLDTITYTDHVAENKWYDRLNTYKVLRQDTTYLTEGTSYDSLFHAYYNITEKINTSEYAIHADNVANGLYFVTVNDGVKRNTISFSVLK